MRMSLEEAVAEPTVLTVTEKAQAEIMSIRASEPEPERMALWVAVTGVSGPNYAYDLYFQALADAGPDDVVQHHGDLSVVIPQASVDKLRGATLDLSGNLIQGGLVMNNPNSPSPAIAAVPPSDLSGDVAQRVMQVLDQQINPSIASHGGHADLVAVEEGTAYLRLSGGCQGCGMASVTLSQGIEVALSESVPEVVRVVDVTDHASGTNPYFEPAKK
jgi:Fe/S biogenesis protein NfuA